MKDMINQIGAALVEASELSEFTAQRSIIEELFPYIHLASRRMSARAISRWLASAHNVRLSDVAISRALRNSEKHWQELVTLIEPAVHTFCDAHNITPTTVLKNRELFEGLETKPPCLDGGNPEREYELYLEAAAILRNNWFSYPDAVREQCWRHLGRLDAEDDLEDKEDNENE